jgi:hypothetical protein
MIRFEIPPELQHLPVYRGFPVPHVVLIDNNGEPHFKVNNSDKEFDCINNAMCNICGKHIQKGEYWFIGGQLSAFHPRGVFNDGPVHHICGHFALQVCPYMAFSQYKAAGVEGTQRIAKQLEGKSDFSSLFNPTQSMKRLSFFVFARAKEYKVNVHPEMHGITTASPARPYTVIEYWLDGKQITRDEAVEILKAKKEHNFLPK